MKTMFDYKYYKSAIRCLSCKEVLISRHTHDYRSCACGTSVDGGYDYTRIGCADLEKGYKHVRVKVNSLVDLLEMRSRILLQLSRIETKISELKNEKKKA